MHNTVDAQRAGNDGFRILGPATWTKLLAHPVLVLHRAD
jgi:hypothetical protein